VQSDRFRQFGGEGHLSQPVRAVLRGGLASMFLENRV